MVIHIKQHLSVIWSSIHEKVKQHWGWVEKSVAYKTERVYAETKKTYNSHKVVKKHKQYLEFEYNLT